MTEKDAAISRLEDEVAEHAAHRQRHAATAAELQRELSGIQTASRLEREMLDGAAQRRQLELDDAKGTIARLGADSSSTIRLLEAEVSDRDATIALLKEQAAEHELEVAHAARSARSHQDGRAEMESQLVDARAQVSRMAAAHEAELREVERRRAEAAIHIRHLEHEVSDKKDAAREAAAQRERCVEALNDAQQRIQRLEREAADDRAQAHAAHVHEISRAEASYGEEKASLSAALSEHRETAQQKESQLVEVRAHVARMEAAHEGEVSELRAENDELAARESKALEATRNSRADLAEADNKIRQLKMDGADARVSCRELSKKVQAAEDRRAAAEVGRAIAEDALARFQEQSAQADTTLTEIRQAWKLKHGEGEGRKGKGLNSPPCCKIADRSSIEE